MFASRERHSDKPGEVFYDVDNSAASQPRRSLEHFNSKKKIPFGFSEVDDCWETHPLALTDNILFLPAIFATLL